ncbi:MAG TPA: hypothetical protein VFU34_03965 [Gaiellaceae bacterium]|nr:hypothetical protein [Gaiellaceae bacterium]
MVALVTPSPLLDSFGQVAPVILVASGIFLGVPLCIAIANDYFKRAATLKRQCRSSEVLVCEGTASDLVAQGRESKEIRRQVGGAEVVLEVLMQSGLVWTINGQQEKSWIVVPRGRTARTPEQARLAARYVRPVKTHEGMVRLHQRALSEAERLELRGYLPSISLKGGLLALLLNALAAGHVVAYARNPTTVPLTGAVLVALALWFGAQLAFALRARRRMRRDLDEGFVVINQPDPDVAASQESVVEFLPYSGAEWTTGGRATAWRRLYGTVGGG